jgi:hypothetical protein
MDPNDDQCRDLQKAKIPPGDPERVKFLLVNLHRAVYSERNACAEQMLGQQHRNTETQHELDHFRDRPAEVPAFIERPEPQRSMRGERDVERDGAQYALPDPHLHNQRGVRSRD